LAYDVFPVILQNLRHSEILFSKETVCEKFQIAREKVVVTVTTVTYKVAPVSKLKTVGHCDGRGLITG